MALRLSLDFPTTSCAAVALSPSKELRNFSGSVRYGRRRPKGGILSSGFSDQGHFQCYNSSFGGAAAAAAESKNGKEESTKKMKKKQLKLVKGLSKDLSTFSQIGFGLDSGTLIDEVKGKMMTEATQLLLEQLEKVKAEEKELKRRKKEEKARSKTAAVMQKCANFDNKDELCEKIPICSKKIEVCMGGKCRKSGSGELLEEFKRELGNEGVVCGCRCMGKCRDGPNVKILNEFNGVSTTRADSLCTGVGLEDVSLIVANLHSEDQN